MNETATTNNNLQWRLIEACGGPSAAARAVGVTAAAPRQWIDRKKIPAHHVIDLCKLSKGAFQPHQIRPDVFGPEVRV